MSIAAVAEQAGEIIVSVKKDLDTSQLNEFERILNNALKNQTSKIIIDLSGIKFISIPAIRILLTLYGKLREQGRELIVRVGQDIFDLFDEVGLNNLLATEKCF